MKKKKTYIPIPIPADVAIGDRFTTLTIGDYCDKTFPIGSCVTYLGISKELNYGNFNYTWPRFQFDNDTHKHRILDFEELKKL